MNTEFEIWLSQRPQVIKDLAKKYPPGEYVIKSGAPYVVTHGGARVVLYSYFENGTIGVVTVVGGIKADIDPQWLEQTIINN